MFDAMARGTAIFALTATLAFVVLTTPAEATDDDVPAPHRHAEAQRKAAAASRWNDSLGRIGIDPNQERWDVGFMALDLTFQTSPLSITGSVGFDVTVVDGPIDRVVLDLDDAMNVTGVGGDAVSFTRQTDQVVVVMGQTYANGASISFDVDYGGNPDTGIGSIGVVSVDNDPLIWSLSEPFGARAWWPCKDTPSDKADSASIHFTVPSGLTAVSNGTLENVVDLGSSTRFEWFERYPITTYLISIAAYPYTEQSLTWTSGDGTDMPVTVWSWPWEATSAWGAANVTASMLTAFEDMFGPYPFLQEKYGQAQFTWGGGMEHQTASSMCCWGSQGLIAHELAHQWYGDQVTCRDFTQIWVNEGFATYSEALWREVNEGPQAYVDEMLAARYLGPGTILVPEEALNDFARIFNGNLSYDKASWVLHMLRGIMGDTDFFEFMRAYASDPNVTYDVAGTDDVRRVAEQVSGLDLQGFFQQWIEEAWYPTFELEWTPSTDQGADEVTIALRQVQTHRLYDVDIDVLIVTEGAAADRLETFSFEGNDVVEVTVPTDAPVIDVQLDPDHWVLHAVEERIQAPTFDRGLLLVNGVDWSTYQSRIVPAYGDSVFTGQQPFEFWDVHPNLPASYPNELPTPRGTGPIPPEVLGEYSGVVWVGNDYLGDLQPWIDAAVLSYLDQGGNVLLLTRRGQNYLTQPRMADLGVALAGETFTTIGSAVADHPDLVPMTATASQTLNSPLSLDQGPNTVNLFLDGSNPSRSLGVWRTPTYSSGPSPTNGSFVHLVGRPYRWDGAALRQNTEVILTSFFTNAATAADSPAPRTRIRTAYPNPFNPRVTIDFALDRRGGVRFEVFDVRGRRVRNLLDEVRPAGDGRVIWNGLDDAGAPVASGVYTVRMLAGDRTDHTKITLVR